MDFINGITIPSRISILTSLNSTERDATILYICLLEGYKTKVKDLHWGAPNGRGYNSHKLLDKFLDILSDYQDVVAENSQVIVGRYLPNTFIGIKQEQTNPLDMLRDLISEVTSFHESKKDLTSWIGIINATEDFLQDAQDYQYLFSLTEY